MQEASNYKIKLIPSKKVLIVRQPVLREGYPIGDCIFDGDDLQTTFHVGLFLEKNLVAVATFLIKNHKLFSEKNQAQLRGMAVLQEYQGKGYGHHILEYGEDILMKQGVKMVWCNARIIAVNFYKKNNYNIKGEPFMIPEIGIHYIMNKTL